MRYVIDRLEETLAICENDDKEIISVSRKELPEAAIEGDVIALQDDGIWILDSESTKKRRERIRKKMMNLLE